MNAERPLDGAEYVRVESAKESMTVSGVGIEGNHGWYKK